MRCQHQGTRFRTALTHMPRSLTELSTPTIAEVKQLPTRRHLAQPLRKTQTGEDETHSADHPSPNEEGIHMHEFIRPKPCSQGIVQPQTPIDREDIAPKKQTIRNALRDPKSQIHWFGGTSNHCTLCQVKIHAQREKTPADETQAAYFVDEEYLVTALVPSETACLASSPGRMRRTLQGVNNQKQ
jgi:ferredoxin